MELTTLDIIASLPKPELHLHLEGSISPSRLHDLAKKYGTEIAGLALEEISEKVLDFHDFSGFLAAFRIVCEHLREATDYVQALDDLYDYFRRESIRYAEVIYSPAIPWKFGRDGEAILKALLEASDSRAARGAPPVRWILDCVRQFGRESAERTIALAESHRELGVVGVGLGGDELANPMMEFAEPFAWAKANGLFVHVHAGEVGGPEEVWSALQVLGANRIGHGIQAARDPKLMEYLKDHAVALDVCLTSNSLTRAWGPISTNPFGLLFRRGVPVTLSTDDPGLFRTSLNREYALAVKHFQLSRDEIRNLILQGVRSSFLPHGHRMELLTQFHEETHRVLQSNGG